MPPKALVFQSNMFHPQKSLAAMPSKRSTPMFPARSDNFQLLFALLLPARKTDYEYLPTHVWCKYYIPNRPHRENYK